MTSFKRSSIPLILAALVGFGCTAGGDGPTNPNTQTPAIAISLSASALDVNQGAASTVTVTLTRSGGFTDAVTVAVSGLPTGVTAANATIAAGATTATLTINAAATAAAATSNLTVTATGTGVTAATAALALSVKTVAVQTPAFTMTLGGSTSSLAQGATGNVTVTIARSGGFSGAVALTVTGAPTGLAASFNPASVTATSSTLSLTAAATLAAGAYSLTIRGTGTGVTDQTATLTVTVTAAGGGSTSGNTTWTFCGTSGLPVFVAAQDGAGAWTRVTSSTNAYSFNITTRGGVAYVVPTSNGGFDTEVFYGTAAELNTQGQSLCNGATTVGVTVNGTMAGATSTDLIMIGMGLSVGTAAANNTTFSIPNVPSGSFDLIAGKSTVAIGAGGVTFTPAKGFLQRSVSSSSSPAIDFAGASAFDFVTRNLTVANLNGEESRSIMTYITANSRGSFYVDAIGSTVATRNFYGVPAARQATGDFHYLNIIATTAGATQITATRNAGIVFNAAADKTVTLGAALGAVTTSSLGGGRVRAVYTVQADYNKYFSANFQQVAPALPRIATIQVTVGYNQSASAVTVDLPDLSGVSGFDTNWLLKTGVSTTWTFSASGWTASGGIVGNPIVEGATYLAATRIGTMNP